jgi:hypothetical protein
VQENYHCLVETLLEMTGAEWVVDSSKQGLQLKYLLRISGLDVRVIRLIRDGRAVALTAMDTPRFADAVDPRFRFGGYGLVQNGAGVSMAQGAQIWRRSNEEAEHLLPTLAPGSCLELHYEELCVSPSETLAKICRFLNLDPSETRPDFRSVIQHVVGNGMRHDATSEVRKDERWRTHLSHADLQVFEKISGNLNRTYGYR